MKRLHALIVALFLTMCLATSSLGGFTIGLNMSLSGFTGGIGNGVTWLLTNVLNLDATIGESATNNSTSATHARVRVTDGLLIEEVPAGVAVTEGARVSYDTDEGATLGSELVPQPLDFTDGGVWVPQGAITVIDETSFSSTAGGVGLKITNLEVGAKYVLTTDFSSTTTLRIKSSVSGGDVDQITDSSGTFPFVAASTILYMRHDDAGTSTFQSLSIKKVTPIFLNSVSKTDATLLHPVKTGDSGEDVYLLYDYRQDSEAVIVGDHRYIVGTDNHNYALTVDSITTGTTAAAPPSIAKADLGGTVLDGGVTWRVDSHYSNIATEAKNHLPHKLSEDEAVNLALQSQGLGFSPWFKTNANINMDAGISPSGTLTADILVPFNAVTGFVSQGFLSVSGNKYTFSVYAKPFGRDWIYLWINDGVAPAIAEAYFNVATGEKGTINAGTSEIEYAGNGYYRISVTGLSDDTLTSASMRIYSSSTDATVSNGDGVNGAYLWQADLVAAATISSPIPTTTGSVQRNATSMTVTPATADFLRLRFADVNSQTYLSSGTVAISYDGTTLTWTDGANAMTHIVAMAAGDQACVEEATGKLYYNNSLVSTNASYTPTWGEIELGNAVDYRFDDALDCTDATWNEVNYSLDYIQYRGRLIPADVEVAYGQPLEEAA